MPSFPTFMKCRPAMALAGLLALVSGHALSEETTVPRFADARQKFATKLTRLDAEKLTPAVPPRGIFNLVTYESPVGPLAAYVGVDPKDHRKHPAIIWLVGGFSNSISDIAWAGLAADNDQSAAAFREAGLLMMYPSLRGGNHNPGHKEGFYGEVDDVLAALRYLKTLDYVDPTRIYLGGHSTGATLALLVSEVTSEFRAVVAFGPVHSVTNYGTKNLPFDVSQKTEIYLRAPILWMQDIVTPTIVIEGTKGNIEPLRLMMSANKNPQVTFHAVAGATHFDILRPVTNLMAAKFLSDKGPSVNIQLSDAELARAFGGQH